MASRGHVAARRQRAGESARADAQRIAEILKVAMPPFPQGRSVDVMHKQMVSDEWVAATLGMIRTSLEKQE